MLFFTVIHSFIQLSADADDDVALGFRMFYHCDVQLDLGLDFMSLHVLSEMRFADEGSLREDVEGYTLLERPSSRIMTNPWFWLHNTHSICCLKLL